MAIFKDQDVDASALVTRKTQTVPLISALSLTDAAIYLMKAQYSLRFLGAQVYARTVAGTVSLRLHKAANTAVVKGGTLAIDAVPEKFKLVTKTIVSLFAGVVTSKAPATAIAFSAADTVNTAQASGLAHWGCWTVQLSSAGAVSTKSYAADQDFATEALAIAARPAADSGKLEIGYITVQTKTGAKWTATTDDLTAASDVTAANFYNTADALALCSAVTPVTGDSVDAVMTAANRDVNIGDNLLVLLTTDGSGVLTNGALTLDYQARGYRGS